MAKKPQITAPEDIKLQDSMTDAALAEQTGKFQFVTGNALARNAAGDQAFAAEDTKTGPALAEQTGTPQPAGGTAAAVAEAAGDQTLAADANPLKGPPGVTVVVTALQPSRWRIGRHFTHEPVSIPADELTGEEVNALFLDPLLTVAVIDAPY
jgi:hypothetical protein